MTSHDGTATSGRKGIAYDWRSLVVSSLADVTDDLDAELAALVEHATTAPG